MTRGMWPGWLSLGLCTILSAMPSAALAEDRHGLQPDDYFVALDRPESDAVYVHVAEMQQPVADTQGAAQFLVVTTGIRLQTAHFWKTRPAEGGGLHIGELAICFLSNQDGTVFRAPVDQQRARTGSWVLGKITDVTHGEHGLVEVAQVTCTLAAMRVPVVQDAIRAAGTRGPGGAQEASSHGDHETGLREVSAGTWDAEVLQSPDVVLVYFTAPWCVPCQSLTPSVQEIAADYRGRLKVLQMNFDEYSTVAQRHQIPQQKQIPMTSLPAVRFYQNGRDGATLTAVPGKSAIVRTVEKVLLSKPAP